MIIIRDGKFEDFEILLPLAHEVHRFSPFADLPINEAQIQRVYVMSLFSDDGFVKVAEDDGKIVGCMVGAVAVNQWGLRVAQDMFMMSRGGTGALIKIFKKWAKERDADMTLITDLCSSKGYREIIESQGFTATGTILVGEN